MTAKKYYPEMDKLRGVAILMVLLFHSILVYPVDLKQYPWCKNLHAFLWMAEMPLFFLVAGFCFQYHGGYKEYLLGKIKRILIPHIVFGAADMLIRVIPNPLVHRTVDFHGAVKEFLLDGANDWFLVTMFEIFLIAPLLGRLLKQKFGTALLMAVSMLALLSYRFVPVEFSLRNTSWFLIFFSVGMILRKKCEQGIPVKVAILIPAAVIGGYGFYLMQHQHWMVRFLVVLFGEITLGYVLRLWLEFAASLGICYTVYCLVMRLQGHSRYVDRFLTLCGNYSLPMYLLDGYALVVTRTLLLRVLGADMPALIVFGNFVADTAIVFAVIHWIIKRFRLTRALCGMK